MESYIQPWTMVNKYGESEPKNYECYTTGGLESHLSGNKKPHYEGSYEQYKWEKPEYCGNGKWEKNEYCGVNSKWEKPTEYYGAGKWEKSEMCGNGKWEKPQFGSRWEKQQPEYYGNGGRWEKTEMFGKNLEQPQWGNGGRWERSIEQPSGLRYETVCGGEWEKVCGSMERCQLEGEGMKPRWSCRGNKCCDEEMIKLVKDVINILIGAEQSYIQLGFLCMDEKFTLVNTSEYFRLCGLRMRWLSQALIGRSVRLFNVNEWINNTTFQNWFKVPSKEELASNDYTSVIKTFFKIALDAENRLVEHMNILGDKMMKTEWNTECRFDGFKWFVNFVLPYQTEFVREMTGHWRNIEMCNNGYIFDKCEMYPLVQKIEQFIHHISKVNTTNMPVLSGWEKQAIFPVNKKW